MKIDYLNYKEMCKSNYIRNVTKRVKEFEKMPDFVNSHLLKGVATMAELTKMPDNH